MGIRLCILVIVLVFATFNAHAATYQVGPGRTYTNLQSVASSLQPGDIVEVDGDTTYPGDVTFTEPGTPDQKITIRGIRINGNRPVISGGTNTVQFQTWPYTEPGADHYVFEGFEVTGGTSRGIFHQADDLTIRDTAVYDCPSQGILGADQGSGSLLLEYVEIYRCGSGTYSHQIYMATDEANHPGSVFRMRHCYIHDGNGGNNVKSRAERNEIYYNRIEGAYYHELEMIGPDGADPGLAREDSDVVGNVFRKTRNFYVTRIGGDGTGATDGRYRFVNNTFICETSAAFRLFDGIESVEMHNNVFYGNGGGGVDMISDGDASWTTGSAVISGSNNWVPSGSTDIPAQWTDTVTGTDPGFTDVASLDLRPATGSPLINAGTDSPSSPAGFGFPSPLFPPAMHPPTQTIEMPDLAEPRPTDATIDIGAYEAISPLVTGDLNHDGRTDLADAIVALKIAAGLEPADFRNDYGSEVDVDNNGKAGLPEAIYALQMASQLR